MNEPWYKKSCFRNLVDMHIVGDDRMLKQFDPEVYADNMLLAGFDTAYIYASNCLGLCLYPSAIGYRHPITEKRDLFGQTVDACLRRGIRPVGYLNNWSTEASDRHPEWRVVGKDGTGYRDREGHQGRYGVCCFNSPYRDYFLSLVKEMCSTYPVEGLWVDMVGFSRTACYCPSCTKLYREKTGREIPEIVNWESREWREYMRFRGESMARYAKDIRLTAQRARPGISVSIQSAGWIKGDNQGYSTEYFKQFDYAGGDFYTDVKDQAVDSKFLRSASTESPFEYMVPRCPDLIYHTVNKPLWQLRQQAYAAYLHGGAFLCIDAIDPEGTLNQEVYRRFARVKQALAPYWELPAHRGGRYVSDVAVYMNFPSAVDLSTSGRVATTVKSSISPLVQRLKSINNALSLRHLQYDILTDLRLGELSRYGAVILSEVYVLSEREIAAFTQYVKEGGCLYVSGRTGILNELEPDEATRTLRRSDFALSELMGVSLTGKETPFDSCYLQPALASGIFDESHHHHPLGTAAPVPEISARKDTRVLATLTLPYSNHTDARRYLSAISDPPWTPTSLPALTEHSFGKGRVIYSAALLEADPLEEVGECFLRVVEELLKDHRKLEITAPRCMEISVKEQENALVICLLNTAYEQTLSSAGECILRLNKSFFSHTKAECFPRGNFDLQSENGSLVLRLRDLAEFTVVTLKP